MNTLNTSLQNNFISFSGSVNTNYFLSSLLGSHLISWIRIHTCAELVTFGLEFLQKGGRNRCESKEAEKARAAEMQQARESWAAAAGAEMNTELPQHL